MRGAAREMELPIARHIDDGRDLNLDAMLDKLRLAVMGRVVLSCGHAGNP